MISRQILKKAVSQNIITPQQLDPLYEFLINQNTQAYPNNGIDEPLKFIRSFGDIFISFGIVLLAYAVTMLPLKGLLYLIPIALFIALSEWLIRFRHLALPGITLLLVLLYFVHRAVEFDFQQATSWHIALISLCSLIFYFRYRIPFSIFPFAAGMVAIVLLQTGLDFITQPYIFSLLGLLVFIVAMLFDIQDTQRKSHKSDTAFWLHLLASPLIVHGLMMTLLFTDQPLLNQISAEWIILSLFSGIFLLALLLDRRAMIISTQIYVIYAVTQLLQNQLNTAQNALIIVLFLVAILVIFFGTHWYKLRQVIFSRLANTWINRYVPDLLSTGFALN